MSDDLVKRLRAYLIRDAGPVVLVNAPTMAEAADAIERLTRERDEARNYAVKRSNEAHEIELALHARAEAAERKVEKLREVLKPFAALANSYDESYEEPQKVSWYKEYCCARTALEETEE